MRAVFVALAGCHPSDDFRVVIDLFEGPSPLARGLRVDTDLPVTLLVTIDGTEVSRRAWFEEAQTGWDLPIIGFLADTTHEVTVLAEDAGGGTAFRTFQVRTAPLPERFPEIDVLALSVDRVEPGFTLMSLEVRREGKDLEPSYLVALDERGRVVWFYTAPFAVGDAELLPEGRLALMFGGGLVEIDWLGQEIRQFAFAPIEGIAAHWVPIPFEHLHHEFVAHAGGYLSMDYGGVTVQRYPTSYDTPGRFRSADLSDDALVWFSSDGREHTRTPLSTLLDTQRIGFDSLNTGKAGFDWVHANAIAIDPADGGIVLSARHQDAVFKLTPEGGVDWILGTPAGFRPPLLGRVLPWPDGGDWPYHSHGVRFIGDGQVLVFDNGNRGHNPYEPPAPPRTSRVVSYRLDSDGVRTVFTHERTATGPLYSPSVGSAQWLPQTGNVTGLYGALEGERGWSNPSLGFGELSVRLVEWAPDGDVVRDLRFRSHAPVEPRGWSSYRAWPVATPWPGVGVLTSSGP